MNKCEFIGRLTKEVSVQGTGDKTVSKFSVAVQRPVAVNDVDVDYINFTAFGKRAEFIAKYMKKGTKVGIVSRFQNNFWTDKDGAKHYDYAMIVDEIEFCESKSKEDSSAQTTGAVPDFVAVPDGVKDEELPFEK